MDDKLQHWPIFVISLQDAIERRTSILRQCRRYGIEPIIIDAIDGRQGLPHGLEHFIDRPMALRRVGRMITDAEFACALSHHFIYLRILKEDLPGAVVLEDDAILTDVFGSFYAAKGYLASDFIQMDHQHASVYRWRRKITSGATLKALAANAGLTTGYSVSTAAARYLVDNSTPLAGFADWPCDVTPLGPLVTKPPIVQHPPFDPRTSYLEKERLQQMEGAAGAKKTSGRWRRFADRAYWKRWWFKRILTKRVS